MRRSSVEFFLPGTRYVRFGLREFRHRRNRCWLRGMVVLLANLSLNRPLVLRVATQTDSPEFASYSLRHWDMPFERCDNFGLSFVNHRERVAFLEL